ncbi:MAG: replicative DNA helicase [Clostridia bacterium]|nr:replicative DNA helicase [Clostridia bacterium]
MPKMKKQFNGYPHNFENEQALLGCIILDPKIQVEVTGTLNEDDFFETSHKLIFNAISEILKANRTVDVITLTDMLEKQGNLRNVGDISYITGLTNMLPSTANYISYLSLVKRDSMLRKLIDGATGIIKECNESKDEKQSLALAEKTVYDIANDADTSEIYKISSVIPDVMTKLDELSKDSSKFRGIRTGYRGLDYILNGFHGSDLMILAARPAMGKTSLAMNLVENIALAGKSCAVFSLEMSKEQLVQRMLCAVANVSMSNALKGQMQKSEWLKIAKAKEMLANTRIFIDESSVITPEEILSKCRRLKRKHGLDFVMIDYIQLMDSKSRTREENRQQQVSEISRNLKILAKELDVPVLALSQLSRAVESEKRRPQLSDLRESGAIEQDADIVMFIHRPDIGAKEKELADGKIQPNVAELIIAKHRNGATGMVKLYFKSECTKFINFNEDTGEPEEKDAAPAKSQKPSLDGAEELPLADNAEDNKPPFDIEDSGVKSLDDELFN